MENKTQWGVFVNEDPDPQTYDDEEEARETAAWYNVGGAGAENTAVVMRRPVMYGDWKKA